MYTQKTHTHTALWKYFFNVIVQYHIKMINHILKFFFIRFLQIEEDTLEEEDTANEVDDNTDTTQPTFYVRHDTHGIDLLG